MIYISGKITGTDDYMQRFADTEKRLTNLGYTVCNPAKVNSLLPEDTEYNVYMDVSLALLKNCNSIFMMNGWQNSNGARCELQYAVAYGKDIYYEEEFEE